MDFTIVPAAAGDSGQCDQGPLICGAQQIGNGIGDAVNGIQNGVNTVQGFADFWSDPAGNAFKALQDAAKGLASTVLPALTHATLPDLTADWFIHAYQVSFALAILVFVVLLVPQILRTARGQMSGQELVETLTLYGPVFLLGSMFGPMLGAFLVKFFGALSDSLVDWGLASSTTALVDKFVKMLSDADATGIAGGAVIGCLLMFFMILALLMVMLMLIVMLITLYFSGVLFPLGWVWIVDKNKRAFGSKIAYLWLGTLAAHPLLFFLLGIVFSMVGANVDAFSNQFSLQKTVTLVVSMLALFIAGFAPLLLFKFAPVLPMGGAGAATAGGPSIGANSMQEADSRYGDGGSGGGGGGSPSGKANESGPSQADAGGSGTAGQEAGGASLKEAAAAGGKAGGAGAGAGAGGAAAGAEGGAMAAGAAESSTGVGAAIGIPTMLAAGAKAAADKGKEVAESSADIAGSAVDDHEEHYGRDSLS